MIEIELKARLPDYEATRRALEAAGARFLGESQKRDLYYGPETKTARDIDVTRDPVFRLRSEGEKWRVTTKRRSMEDGIETNEEVEFGVDDAVSFREFAQRIGFRPFIVKKKDTRTYELGEACVELHRIEPIGDFIEIEVLLEDGADEDARRAAEAEIRSILERAGVPEVQIESRLYVDLLRAAGAGGPPSS